MVSKNYILSKEKGNKTLVKNFREYKITGWILFFSSLAFGILLIIINLNRTDFSSSLFKNLWGIFLVCLSPLFLLTLLPLKMKVTEYKDEFLIEKVCSFWIKKEFKINKKEKPIIVGIKQSRFTAVGGDGGINLSSHLYNLRFSYNVGKVNLYWRSIPSGFSHWDTSEQIKEIANFFNLSYKLIN